MFYFLNELKANQSIIVADVIVCNLLHWNRNLLYILRTNKVKWDLNLKVEKVSSEQRDANLQPILKKVNRGYYTVARTYEVYLLVEKKISLVRMFKPTSNFLLSVSKITLILQCPKQRNDVSDIFTSEDMENMSLVSRMYFHMKSTSDVVYSKTLISMKIEDITRWRKHIKWKNLCNKWVF